MPYKLEPGKFYRMPTHFGPSPGPRQSIEGKKYLCKDTPSVTTYVVRFLTNSEQLDEMLPEGFTILDEPIVTVEVSYITNIEWLAGRGYNTLGVSFPVTFQGKKDRKCGRFVSVLWESLADPIITGREELGYAKLYCEIPPPVQQGNSIEMTASWLGFSFASVTFDNLKKLNLENNAGSNLGNPKIQGSLHYKYIPKTGEMAEADASYVTFSPFDKRNFKLLEASNADATVKFHKCKWEDLPTMHHIVNALSDLEIKEYRQATRLSSVGGSDLSEQQILR